MSEFRQDRTSGAWVIVAPERGHRPNHTRAAAAAVAPAPDYDPSCPFCPGNEERLPGIIDETQAEGPPGWSVRVVPNKYPALRSDNGPSQTGILPAVPLPGFGYHEVVIETPRHDLSLSGLAAPDISAVIETYRNRYRVLATKPGIKSVLVFRNRGHGAGASLRHPHSQVIASGIMPPRLAMAAEWARRWHGRTGQCPTCEELRAEENDGSRLIEASDGFLAFVPFAATAPYEVRIVPRNHAPSFALADDSELEEFNALLQRTIRRLDVLLGRQPYNYVIEAGIVPMVDALSFHWRLRVVANLTRPGGFELASGMPINPSLPEADAEALRAVKVVASQSAPPKGRAMEDDDEPAIER